MGLTIALFALLQDDWGQTVRDFDSQFRDSDKFARILLIDRMGKHDKPQAVDRLIKAFDIVEKGLDELMPEQAKLLKEGKDLPEIKGAVPGAPMTSSYLQAVAQYNAHFAKEREVGRKIQDLLDTRAAAVKALGGFRSDDTVETLLKRMRSLSDEWDREGLAEAAGKVEHAAVSPALIERVKEDKSWRVRVVALDSLRARKAVEALDAAIAALRDAFWQVQVAAVEAVEAFGDKRAVPGLIEALKGADGRIKAEINRVLAKLTGVDKGGDPAAWSSWWEQNRGAVERGEYKPSPSEAADNKAKQTTFYGIPIESKRLVFVIDKSGSMVEPSDWKADGGYIGTGSDGKPVHDKPEGTRKIDIAKFELRMAIRGLPEDTLFTIVSFADNTAGWKETLVPANKKNKEEAIAWVNALDPSGGTNTFEALRSGFAVQGPPGDKKKEQGADTLFFLTDGRPSVGEITDTAQILAKAAEWNATRKIKINTIAVGKENLEKTPEGGGVDPEFLKQLAEAHRGFHVWRK